MSEPWQRFREAGNSLFRLRLVIGLAGMAVVLMVVAAALAAGVLMLIGMCVTCCVAALPYLSSVVFLPILVFFRCYALCFLEQVAPEWTILPPSSPAAEPPVMPPAVPGETSALPPEDPA